MKYTYEIVSMKTNQVVGTSVGCSASAALHNYQDNSGCYARVPLSVYQKKAELEQELRIIEEYIHNIERTL